MYLQHIMNLRTILPMFTLHSIVQFTVILQMFEINYHCVIQCPSTDLILELCQIYSFESQSKWDSEKISRIFSVFFFCTFITSSTYVWKTCCHIRIDQDYKSIVMKLHGSSQTLIILFFLFRKRNSKSVFEIILIIKSVIRQTTELIVHSSSWLMITRW